MMQPSARGTTNLQKQSEQPVQKLIPPGTYDATPVHKAEWEELGLFPDDTPIARAWRRLFDRGIMCGSPTHDAVTTDNVTTQRFEYSRAVYLDDGKENPSQMVEFSDARGLVGTDSGL